MSGQDGIKTVGRRLKVYAGLTALSFGVTLAVIIGSRLGDEALAVLAGAVCGVGAAIPTSLLVVAVTRRQDRPARDGRDEHRPLPAQPYPPVIVVAPPGERRLPDGWGALPSYPLDASPRRFTVVGGDDDVESEI
jgi:hypothetical protein